MLQVTVDNVDDAPVITGQSAITIDEDATRTIALADLTVTDIDNSYPTGFTLTVADGTNYTHTGNAITPAANFNGTLSVGVTVNDGTLDSICSPSASPSAPSTTPRRSPARTRSASPRMALAPSCSAIVDRHRRRQQLSDGFTLTVGDGASYTHTGNTIAPAANFNGTLTVPVVVNDGVADSNVFDLSVTVTAVDDAPVISGQNAITFDEDTSRIIAFADLVCHRRREQLPDRVHAHRRRRRQLHPQRQRHHARRQLQRHAHRAGVVNNGAPTRTCSTSASR